MGTEGYKRKISAILSADVAGYSRLMEGNESAKLALVYEDMGEYTVKNSTTPVHVYRIPMDIREVLG